MPHSFSSIDAKSLIKTHKATLKQLRKSKTLSDHLRKEILSLSLKLERKKIFQRIAKNELLKREAECGDEIKQLFRLLYSYAEIDNLGVDKAYSDYSKAIKEWIKKLSVGANRFRWFIALSKKKNNAELAYHQLQLECNNEPYLNAKQCLEDINSIQNATDDEVWKAFVENRTQYGASFLSIISHRIRVEEPIPDIQLVLQKIQALQLLLSNAHSKEREGQDKVEVATNGVLSEEVMNTLRGIPVDEINRDKKGIRVKLLKDNGFPNIATIVASSTYRIASIYGISEEGANIIKRRANAIAEQTRNNTKIKLSVDHKTKATTALISELFEYRALMKKIKALTDFERETNPSINNDVSQIKSVGNGASWLFFDEEQKASVRRSFADLLARTDGQYAKDVQRLSDTVYHRDAFTEQQAWGDFQANSIAYVTTLEGIVKGILDQGGDGRYGLPEELAAAIQEECFFPDGLNCELRKYQEWGVKYILHQERVLLGDEMGLGKTIQAIATMVSLRNTGAKHFAVVCPASVLPNWFREITSKSKLSAFLFYKTNYTAALNAWIRTGGVLVTNYETVKRVHLSERFRFELLVVDEAHFIKNPDALRSQNVRNLSMYANRLLFMTGTALENNVQEMISLIALLQPPIANMVGRISFLSNAPQFREKIAPVYYRRKREDVLTELPDLIETDEWLQMSDAEERKYEETVLSKNFMQIRRLSWNVGNFDQSVKAERMRELIEDAKANDRKVLVFSFFLDTIRDICNEWGEQCFGPISGSIPPQRRQDIINEFEQAEAGAVLCAQIQSGGTGLNIQAASVVIICEPQFKPSIEMQAISRAYRMGQPRNVLVYRLLCENSIDEKMVSILKEKQRIFDEFADRSFAADAVKEVAAIDDHSFAELIQEEIDRINKKKGVSAVSTVELPEPRVNKEDVPLNKTAANKDAVGTDPRNSEETDELSLPNVPQEETESSALTLSKQTDYKAEMGMTYSEMVAFLKQKYGPVKGDYFCNENCRSKNHSIVRTKESLFCHHIDEDKAIMLSRDTYAKNNPYEYQKAERLVYCNILEHLLLHIKITEEPRQVAANLNEIQGIGGAVNYLCAMINDYYNGYPFSQEWMLNVTCILENRFEDYIMILQHLFDVVKSNPIFQLVIGKNTLSKGSDGTVVDKVFKRLR